MIYFLRSHRMNLIKIGRSRFLASRKADLEYQYGETLELLGVMTEPDFMEQILHRAFRQSRMHGEWFEPTKVLLGFIRANARPWTPDMDEPGGSRVSVKIDRAVYYHAKRRAKDEGVADVGDWITSVIRPIVSEPPDDASFLPRPSSSGSSRS